jgi:hypothetical protein
VAASVGSDQFLSLHRRPDATEFELWPPGGPHTLMLSGIGDYESEPQPRHDLFGLNWAVAVDDLPAPCPVSVTLEPVDGPEPVVAVDASTVDVEAGQAFPETPWRPVAGDSWDAYTVSVRSGCTWTFTLWPAPHD